MSPFHIEIKKTKVCLGPELGPLWLVWPTSQNSLKDALHKKYTQNSQQPLQTYDSVKTLVRRSLSQEQRTHPPDFSTFPSLALSLSYTVHNLHHVKC